MGPMFDVHPEVGRASTIPSRFYCDPGVFERSKDQVFA